MPTSNILRMSGVLVIVAAAAGGFYLYNHAEAASPRQSTDDAYTEADLTVVSPQVSGRIAEVLVEDHQAVRPGDLLAVIDDRDLRVALDSAKAQVLSAQATIDGLEAQIARQTSAIDQADAAVDAGDAALVLARANRTRFRNLARDGSGTVQALQQAHAELQIQEATHQRDKAALAAARQQTDILRADLEKARADLAHAKAAQAAAELNLSYTRITAPVAGVVGQRSVRVGAYVTTGRPLVTLVPLDALYIEANYRETQLARVRPGQAVSFTVDGLPGVTLAGHVESLGPASGVSFSAVPPHNATGNFTKIVQRLPVRIAIDPDQPAARMLRVGMSVIPEIDVSSVEAP
jgi:membrane fusion protein (multidrug efflux system)